MLGLERDQRKSKDDDWWTRSFLRPEETRASLHVNDRGWYDFGACVGGGPIELVQEVMKVRGRIMNCYEAGLWLVEQGVSSLSGIVPATARPEIERTNEVRGEGDGFETAGEGSAPATIIANAPIRQNLLPRLTQQGEHPEFVRRGISKTTCERLGCGYLPAGRSVLAGRIVFQVRGVREQSDGSIERVILSHLGRATTDEQEQERGKWLFYAGFQKSRELYGIDHILLDEDARRQLSERGTLILVEGCFDVAKLVEADARNAVASFGAHLAPAALPSLDLVRRHTGIGRVFVWYDRDDAGRRGQTEAIALLGASGFEATGFDWTRTFPTRQRGSVPIPETLRDVCDLSVRQLDWLCKTLNI